MTGRAFPIAFPLTVAVSMLAGSGSIAARPSQKSALVTVVAEGGAPIRNLTAKDFIVKEDGSKREVLEAHLSDDPLSIVFLMETTQPVLGGMPPAQDLRASASAFVKAVHAVTPDAQIAFGEVAGAAVITVDFTSKTDALDKAIAKLYPNPQRGGVLLEGLVDAAKMLAGRPAPRRAIVTVDFNSLESSAERTMKDAVTAVHDAGATLWAVSVRGTEQTTPGREEVLNKVTKANGGMRFSSVDASGLTGALTRVAATLSSQYIVAFTHPGDGAAKSTTFETATGGPKVLLSPFMR